MDVFTELIRLKIAAKVTIKIQWLDKSPTQKTVTPEGIYDVAHPWHLEKGALFSISGFTQTDGSEFTYVPTSEGEPVVSPSRSRLRQLRESFVANKEANDGNWILEESVAGSLEPSVRVHGRSCPACSAQSQGQMLST